MRESSFQNVAQLRKSENPGRGVSSRSHRIGSGKSRVRSTGDAHATPESSGLVQTHPLELGVRAPKVTWENPGAESPPAPAFP